MSGLLEYIKQKEFLKKHYLEVFKKFMTEEKINSFKLFTGVDKAHFSIEFDTATFFIQKITNNKNTKNESIAFEFVMCKKSTQRECDLIFKESEFPYDLDELHSEFHNYKKDAKEIDKLYTQLSRKDKLEQIEDISNK